ncbi:MAG: hypothetical protein U0326_20605 [Polyangiales bacterium]
MTTSDASALPGPTSASPCAAGVIASSMRPSISVVPRTTLRSTSAI